MISVLTSSVVDRGLKPRSGQIKAYKIGVSCLSGKHVGLRSKSKDRLAGNWIMNQVTCVPALIVLY
jgi:hypothetical protein